ncbi:ABC transporter ATP-binding protein [Brachybacterium sp. GCM10030268]|uniref:ABC transporter ATP-binding protein n=1 Tax=Brachybacterium sp. GCM10030268 TaxID=3273382 RepID=UPI003607DF7E
MSSLTCTDLSLTYPGGTRALDRVSLAAADGEFLALVGPSGSGKTSLLRAIAGFVQPDAGTITLGETTVSGADAWVPPERRGLGMVFQQHAIWPHWSVGRNVDYPLRRTGLAATERRRRTEHALELVGLAEYRDRNPATLSGGQRQRVALARALAARPRVLLLDEALSALDEPLRAAMRVEIRMLAEREGLTVVHVTHDREEALAVADRVAVLDHGALQQVGTPQELVEDPATSFVASFLADATLLDVVPAGDELRLRTGGHRVPVDVVRTMSADGPGSARADTLSGADADGPGSARADDSGSAARPATGHVLAVLPEEVRLRADPEGEGHVESSLFTRTGAQVQLTWHGQPLQARVPERGLRRGDRVDVRVGRALLYGGAGGATAP